MSDSCAGCHELFLQHELCDRCNRCYECCWHEDDEEEED